MRGTARDIKELAARKMEENARIIFCRHHRAEEETHREMHTNGEAKKDGRSGTVTKGRWW